MIAPSGMGERSNRIIAMRCPPLWGPTSSVVALPCIVSGEAWSIHVSSTTCPGLPRWIVTQT